MANWIKFRTSLWDDGRVRKMSRSLRTHRGHVVGALVHFWSLADEFATSEGFLEGFVPIEIDDYVGLEGFVKSLPPDWCEIRDDGLFLPEYIAHNGTTTKQRAVDAKRKAQSRNGVQNMSDPPRTEIGLEKRRVDKSIKNPPTPQGGKPTSTSNRITEPSFIESIVGVPPTEAFLSAWRDWIARRKEIRHPMTELAATRALKKIKGYGYGRAIEGIEFSIDPGYRRIVLPDEPLRSSRRGQRATSQTQQRKPNAEDRGEYGEPDSDLPRL